MREREAPVSTRYSTPVSSSLMLKVAYEGQAATVWGSLSTRFLARHRGGGKNMLWHRSVDGIGTANFGFGTAVLKEGVGIVGGLVASLIATGFSVENLLRRYCRPYSYRYLKEEGVRAVRWLLLAWAV